MSEAYVGSAQASGSGVGTLAIPYVSQQGTTLILGILLLDGSQTVWSVIDNAGNTWTGGDADDNHTATDWPPFRLAIFRAPTDQAISSVIITLTGGQNITAILGEYSGQLNSALNVGFSGNFIPVTRRTAALTPTITGQNFAVLFFYGSDVGIFTGPDAGGNQRQTVGGIALVDGPLDQATSSTVTNFTETVSQSSLTLSVNGFYYNRAEPEPQVQGDDCCAPQDPPAGPFNDFTELDQALFFPGATLRSSTVDRLNKNILEATLSPEFFNSGNFSQNGIVPLPVSPVDGYAYSRSELTYLWNWNNTGPESDIRLPIFGAHIDASGVVHLDVWRLPPGTFPRQTDDGSLHVIAVGSRQAQQPEVVDVPSVEPGAVARADGGASTVSFDSASAPLPPTVLFTVPVGGAGLYQITYSAKVQQVAQALSGLGGTNGFQATYTDANDLQELTTVPGPTNHDNLLTSTLNGTLNINVAENTDVVIQFDYVSQGTPAMIYSLDVSWRPVAA